MRLLFAGLLIFVAGLAAGYGLGVRKHDAPGKQREVYGLLDGGTYSVRHVIDGDTVVLENGVHVRYLGISSPETGRFVKDPAPLSDQAAERNIALVEDKHVRLQLAPQPLDIHGRIVARLFVPGENGAPDVDVSKTLLQEGLAKIMTLGLDANLRADLEQTQEQAKTAKLGLWALPARGDPAVSDKPYCASSNSKLYHLVSCPTAARISAANLHFYATKEEAEAAGLVPCSKCMPQAGGR